MSRLVWNSPEERFIETGLDRGVIYLRRNTVGSVLSENLFENPSFETGTSGWIPAFTGTTGTTSFESYQTPNAPYGSRVGRITASGLGSGVNDRASVYSALISLSTEKTHTVGATFGGSLPPGKEFFIQVDYIDNSDELVGSSTYAFDEAGRHEELLVVPYYASYCQFIFGVRGVGSGIASSVDVWVDGMMLKQGSTNELSGTYFDGSTPASADIEYEWTGVPHESTSISRQRESSAVVWNGLTACDEQGGDSATSYYIDGRPFLYLPRPKEYKANLKAYTYPDEFAEVMGVAEITDGMYLDSQIGEVFDLSYRTLVGNAIEGLDHGYKIHLVYNATVTPQAMSYSSLSNSINPTEFEWEIQAVPVRVNGYRATAHVIIDTRHMDPGKIEAIERLLYGDENTPAHMPSPETIFDILSYGDTIIVTDNGDGTFDVTGSYENVYLIGPGVFRVDNVDGSDNGDGTFTISTTTT